MLKSSPSAPQPFLMRQHRPMNLSGSSSLSPISFSRAFSHGRPFRLQGTSIGQIKGSSRPRINFTRPQQQRQYQRRGFSSSRQEGASLSQKLRKLSREYGWSALGVYLLLSAVDFPFCFAAVRFLGADRIGHYEHVILQTVADGIHAVWPGKQAKESESEEAVDEDKVKAEKAEEQTEQAAAKKKTDQASLWTQLALAYAIHKSLIFIRVPLTAAITPKVVKVLRAWGVDITRRRP